MSEQGYGYDWHAMPILQTIFDNYNQINYLQTYIEFQWLILQCMVFHGQLSRTLQQRLLPASGVEVRYKGVFI